MSPKLAPAPSRKLARAALALGVIAAACGPPRVVIQPGQRGGEAQWFLQILDTEADVGHGLSLAVDDAGNPHTAYLGFEEPPEEGEPPPVPEPDAPVFPAVLHAHVEGDLVTRSPVADSSPPEGEEEPVERALVPEDETAIAVDPEGVHHVAWTEGGSLLYANNAAEDFGEPVEVASGGVTGISIAAAEGGTAWIAFYDAAGVRAASIADDRATVEDVASAQVTEPAGTGIGLAGEEVLVAYGDGSATMLARRDGGEWSTESADQDGGVGVGLAVDAEGNPHIAYFNPDGAVKHAHSIDGGTWEVSDVGDVGGAPGSPAAIALDAEGIHHIAWESAEGVSYASNAEGDFAEEEVPGTEGGARPRLGAGTDETLFLAWFDPEGTEIQLAVRAEEEPLLALPESPTAAPEGAEPPPAECQPDGTALTVVAPPGATTAGFDKTCMAAPAGQPFSVAFDNQDSAIHNWALYTNESATEPLGGGPLEQVAGGESVTYEVDPIEESGQYFYRCDFHPVEMVGTFVVAGEGGAGAEEEGQGGGAQGGGDGQGAGNQGD